jgi:hypothetical protein
VEQGPRSAAMDEAVDLCFIHVSGPPGLRPLSLAHESRFCFSAPNICLLQPKCEGRRNQPHSIPASCARTPSRPRPVSDRRARIHAAAGRIRLRAG